MTTLNERLNSNTPIQKRRGRPAKVLEATDLNHRNNEASEIKERKMVGKPQPTSASSIKIDGSSTKSSFITSGDKPKPIRTSTTKSNQMKTTNNLGDIRNQEKDVEYKAELQRCLKERLSRVRLD